MARLSFLSLAVTIAISFSALPTAYAGPACARRHWKGDNCVSACKSKWGWPGKEMGTDPWGAVMKPAQGTDDVTSIVSKACGTAKGALSSPPNATQSASASAITTTAQSTILTSPGSSTSSFVSSTTSSEASTIATSSSSKSIKPATSSSSSSSSSKPTSSSTSSSEKTSSTAPANTEEKKSSSSSSKAPASTTSSSAPKASSTGSSGSTSGSDIDQYLSAHNSVRAQHGASALTWSDEAAGKAQQWANGCKFEHSGGSLGPFGENLAAGTGDGYDIATAIKSWTDEVSDYDAGNPQPSHFTQVVWKGTTQVGCALQMCDGIFDSSFGKAKYYVCEYTPQGNIIGQFAQNVQA